MKEKIGEIVLVVLHIFVWSAVASTLCTVCFLFINIPTAVFLAGLSGILFLISVMVLGLLVFGFGFLIDEK